MDDVITRLTYDGREITAPAGTNKCAQTPGPLYPADWVHGLFAADNPGPMVQLTTRCGGRAHQFVLDTVSREIDCPKCLEIDRG